MTPEEKKEVIREYLTSMLQKVFAEGKYEVYNFLYAEREKLNETKKNKVIIYILPVRVQNAFSHIGVKTDEEIKLFFEGYYDSKLWEVKEKTPKGRLLCLRNVGVKNAEEAIEIMKKYGLWEDV